ncbi:MAG: malate/lactate/ureidoglycolate dehydrogenase [Burkholderiaceae bacterium]
MAERSIAPGALHDWTMALWRCAGSSEDEARQTADHLVGANLSGHDSHGVGMVPRYVQSFLNDELRLNQCVEVVMDSGTMLTVDGRRGMGQAVTHQAMALAIERARRHGVCVLGLRNSHHLGRVGHWAEQAIDAGLVSIHFTNVASKPVSVAPHGGTEARFITNPFTVGIPRGESPPIVLDFATSSIAMGKVRVAYNKKTQVPPDSLLDSDGQVTRDPAAMFAPASGKTGALLPFAGHKGYALAVVCELLAAALTGGTTCQPDNLTMTYGVWNNMLAIVFDPARIGSKQAFEQEARKFVEWVQSARPREGFDAILMPGDPERASARERAEAIPIDDGTMAQLDAAARAIAERLGDRHAPPPGPLSARCLPAAARS